jgi:NAD+ kinase
MRIQRVLIVNRKSLYQIYVQEHEEKAVKRALRRRDPAALALKESHEANAQALAVVERTLRRRGIEVVTRWRAHFRSTRSFDLVISLGGDGTLLDTSHRIVDDTPLVGINSDPRKSVGALCCGEADRLPWVLDGLETGELRPVSINRIRARVDGQPVLGPTLNDVLFAHECPAGLTRFDRATVAARQALDVRPERNPRLFRRYRGSGLWVSTAIGSTAAIHSAGGRRMPRRSRRLQYLVREPYVAPGAAPPPDLRGLLAEDRALVLFNRLRRGMLWADGVHRSLGVSYGQQIVLDSHPVPLRLVLCSE